MQSISFLIQRKFLFSAAGLAVLLFAAGRCQAATLNVPGDYPTIQAAINAAANGDTIIVAAGTYPESISWSATSLTLQGAGAGQSIVDPSTAAGGPGGSCMTLTNVPSTAIIEGFTFQNGAATYGGGMYNTSSSPSVTNCSFSGDGATYGGGMYNGSGSGPTVTNCSFSGNSASDIGGGMENFSNSSVTVTDCTFNDNSANHGAGMLNECLNPTITGCSFSGNTAFYDGGGMSNYGRQINGDSGATVTNCCFTGNTGVNGGEGGGMYNSYCSSNVTNCSFSGNSGSEGGGICNSFSNSNVTSCSFSGNSATGAAGIDGLGGGMYNYNSSPTTTSCSFTGNSANDIGGGMYNDKYSSPTITNGVFWGDADREIYTESGASPTITYTDAQFGDGTGYTHTGEIDTDPLFVRKPFTNGPTDYGDLHLQAGSPCIDAGNVAVVKSPPFLTSSSGTIIDLDGNPRIENGAVDMGAYEYQKPPIANPGSNQVVEATGPTTPVTFDGSKSSDPDGDTLSYRWTDSSNTTIATTAQVSLNLGVGTYSFALTVTDPSGSSGSASVQVIVQDTTPPTISGVPSNFNVAALKPSGSVVTYTAPTAADRVDGTVAVTCTPASGSTFPLGVTTVTCTATDAAGNKATATFQVNVTLGFRPPVLRFNPLSGARLGSSISHGTVQTVGTK